MRNRFSLGLTFLFAFILVLLPMPQWAIWFRPAWVLLVLIYWNITFPYVIGVGIAWFLGLLLDVLGGTLLGEHALAMTIVSYIAIKMHARIQMFPLLQQGLCIFLLVLFYQLIIYCVQGFTNDLPKTLLFWSSSFISMLLWPLVTGILNKTAKNM